MITAAEILEGFCDGRKSVPTSWAIFLAEAEQSRLDLATSFTSRTPPDADARPFTQGRKGRASASKKFFKINEK